MNALLPRGIAESANDRRMSEKNVHPDFSPECLRGFLSRSGFEVVYMGLDPCYKTTGLKRAKDGLDFRAWGLLYALFGIHCYQTLLVVARSRTLP